MSNILVNFYDKIRTSINVSEVVRNHVVLQRKGEEFSGVCPFHSEKTPSFTVNDKKRFYHCFGCGAHGDLIKFESEQTGISYKDAAYKIADKFGIERPIFTREQEKEQEKSDRLSLLLSQATNFFISNMDSKIRDILHKRGILDEAIAKYKIGYTGSRGALIEYFNTKNARLDELESCGLLAKNPDGKYYEVFRERIIIPIFSPFGKVIAFGGRSIGLEMPKYLNSPETTLFKKGECVYGEDIATASAYKSGRIIVVEGYFDAISMHQAGFLETVASLGTAVTTAHLQKLWKIAGEIIICLDGDDSGIRATKKLLDTSIPLVSGQSKISFITLPKKLDPDELVKRHGTQGVASVIESRMGLSEYIFYSLTYEKLFSSAEDKAKLELELDNITAKIKDSYLKKNMTNYFRQKCWELFNNKKVNKAIKKTILIEPHSSHLANTENVILCFLVLFSDSFEVETITKTLLDIGEQNNELKDLIEVIIRIIDYSDKGGIIDIGLELKKTSFCEQFELLCARYRGSLPHSDDETNKKEILDFLLMKRYLIHLTDEFATAVKTEDSKSEGKMHFYLTEIKSTKEKIEKFNMLVTNK